jgi:mycothiol synthase
VASVTTLRKLGPLERGDVVVLGRLHDAAEAVDGHASLNDDVWRDLELPGSDSFGLLAVEGEDAVGYVHARGVKSSTSPHWEAGFVVHPAFRGRGIEGELLGALIDEVARSGGGVVVLWVLGAEDVDDDPITAAGFERQRELLEMRVPLPLAQPVRWPDGIEARSFIPGTDNEAWLAVNNRAFAGHPEQGGWVEATLRRRMAEQWFDPAGFVLAFDDEGLAGFCWTKVHPAAPGADEQLGEIFVIGVDPSRHGTGLGRALTVAGLASLAERGLRTGMLFVDGANEPAVGLYRSLGFETVRSDRAYAREVAVS